MARNILYVVQGHDHPALLASELRADQLSWTAGDRIEDRPHTHWVYGAKTRYRQKDVPAVIEQLADGKIKVTFDELQRAITPGQAVVFYDGDYVVGGGIIAAPLKE